MKITAKRMALLALMVWACAQMAQGSASLLMLVDEGGRKCFLEEVPKDTLVLVKFKGTRVATGEGGVPEQPQEGGEKQLGGGWIVNVEGPFSEFIARREMGSEGRYAFTSQSSGEHKICLQTNGGGWFGTARQYELQVDIETGVGATDYSEVARLESLSAMEVELRQLNDAVQEIIGEQLYQKKREVAFRETSELTNSRVMWWSIGQTVLLIGSAFWQIRHLKAFFHQKKVV